MPITVTDIVQKSFRIKLKGYDTEEVDRYLDDICDQMDILYQHIDTLQQRLAQTSAAPAPAARPAVPPPAAMVPPPAAVPPVGMPYAADQAQNELNQARQKARGIIEEAQQDAREIRQQAKGLMEEAQQEAQAIRDEAQTIRDEAQAMLDEAVRMQEDAAQAAEEVPAMPAMTVVNADELEAMEERKTALLEEIEMLRATARDYRHRFQRLGEDQQHVLNAETELFE